MASHSPDTGSAKTDATRILLVDDDAVLAGMLGEFLEREGCAVHHAGNGEDALDRISRNVYDLLVLDIMMPRMNGLDVLRELRGGSTLPVIMLTARETTWTGYWGWNWVRMTTSPNPLTPGNCSPGFGRSCGEPI